MCSIPTLVVIFLVTACGSQADARREFAARGHAAEQRSPARFAPERFGQQQTQPQVRPIAMLTGDAVAKSHAAFLRHWHNEEIVNAWFNCQDFYHGLFVPLLCLTFILGWATRPQLSAGCLPEGFGWFRFIFMAAWIFAAAADWLQGPYVYALYASYGFAPKEIAQLFVVGFGSSMVFGTFVGSLADRFGRKRCALLYCVLYAASCMTKHFNVYEVLMVGRMFGGISTSLLFSTFECWMVAEHGKRPDFGEPLLRYMFGLMFFSMYAVAIVAGICAQWATQLHAQTPLDAFGGHFYIGGFTAPFDLAMVMLLLAAVPISLFWEENMGDCRQSSSIYSGLQSACKAIVANPRIATLGLIAAAFEGSMFAFVFNWTPALETQAAKPPHGLAFSLLMMACMCGASTFNLVSSNVRSTAVLFAALSFAAVAFVLAAGGLRDALLGLVFCTFLLFEFCVGVYFPAMGMLKSDMVPEASRAGVYNLFRVPLNFIVCVLLLTNLSLRDCFLMCSGFLLVATGCVGALHYSETPVHKAGQLKVV